MRRGGISAGEKNAKLRFRGEKEKGRGKKRKICIVNGSKGLKIASFWVVNSKNFRGGLRGLISPPPTPPSKDNDP